MSLRRGIKTFGFKGFVQMGAAAATGYLSILGYLYKRRDLGGVKLYCNNPPSYPLY